jgi:hypothetical protein
MLEICYSASLSNIMTQIFLIFNWPQYRRMRFSTCLRQMGHSDMRSPHIWHVPCPQRKIMFLRRSRHTGHMVCSLMSCSCCCNFCISELDVSRLPLFIRHTGSTGTPPVKESRRHYSDKSSEHITHTQLSGGSFMLSLFLFFSSSSSSTSLSSSLLPSSSSSPLWIKLLSY